jgi:hypothetical protein
VLEPHLSSLLDVLGVFRIALTRPSFTNMLVVACGWILTQGPHAVTEALVMTGVAGRRHHEVFHRFFSRGTWEPDQLGLWLFQRLKPFLGEGAIRIAIDDTVAPKKGPHVFGIGTHIDAVRSTRRFRVFCFGHCWVVLAVLVRVPFSRRTWGLPVLFRLYRSKKECSEPDADYSKKTELARKMLDVFVSWVGDRRVELAADSAYCNATVIRGMPSSVVLFGTMRPDAVLTALPAPPQPGKRGRPSKRGATLPKPQTLAKDDRVPWQTCTAELYGRRTKVRFKTLCAQWYIACGAGLLRIVIVAMDEGQVPFRVFFCTESSVDVVRLLETYAGRWGIEVFFREGKQLLGFADSSARTETAVRRVAPFVGLLYTVLVVWFLEGAAHSQLATPPLRPWYPHKQGFSFADILRAARRAMAGFDILDPANDSEYLKKHKAQAPLPDTRRRRLAA